MTSEAPAGHITRSDAVWAQAERDYLAGWSQAQVCDRYGLKPSAFKARARAGGWRRCDQPEVGPAPILDDDLEADEPVDCAGLAEDALARVRRALRQGRAAEAASWMRLHEKLVARQAATEEQARRRERVAEVSGSGAAEDPLVRALRPLKDRMTFINGLGAAQVRVSRAWRQGQISDGCYERFNGLHTAAVQTLDALLAADDARLATATGPTCSTTDFSAAPDP